VHHTCKAMQSTMQQQTKKVGDLVLVWSEPEKKWAIPMPESAQAKLLLDEATGLFEVRLNPENLIFRQRTATANDGTTLVQQELFRDTQAATPETIEAQKRAIIARQLEAKLQLWESVVQLRPLVVGGMFIAMCAALWSVVSAVDAMAGMIAKAVVLALTELAYFVVWIIGGLAVLFIVRAVVLYAFSGRRAQPIEQDFAVQEAQEAAKEGNINIIVQQGGGLFGAQSPAQQILSNR